MAAFQLKNHSLDVLVVLVPMQELQTFLRIAPLQNLDGFLASAPRIHFALVRHVQINCVAASESPAVIFDAISLTGR